jgi:hypothetical protein
MTADHLAVGVSIVAVLLQGLNGYLYLRVENAILKSEKSTERWAEDEFVRKETCDERHGHAPAARASHRA